MFNKRGSTIVIGDRCIGTFDELGLHGSFLYNDYAGIIKDKGLNIDVNKVVGCAVVLAEEAIKMPDKYSIPGLIEAAMCLDFDFIMIDFSAPYMKETESLFTEDDIIALTGQLDAIPELIKGTRYMDLKSYEFRTSIVRL